MRETWPRLFRESTRLHSTSWQERFGSNSSNAIKASRSKGLAFINTSICSGVRGTTMKSSDVSPLVSNTALAGKVVRVGSGSIEQLNVNPPRLTPRQLQVLKLLCEGLPNKLICRRLNIASGT